MATEAPTLGVESVVQTLRIIVPAMAMGVILFLAVVFFISAPADNSPSGNTDSESPEASAAQRTAPEQTGGLPLLTILAVAGLGGAIVARFVVVPVVVSAKCRQIGASADMRGPISVDRALAGAFQIKTIIAVALLEGPAFLAVIAFMIERSPIALGIAVLLVIGILAHFPSEGQARSWVDEQLRRIDEDKAVGRVN